MSPTRDVGWYRDPAHPDQHRFWDGHRWQRQADHLRLALLGTHVAPAGDDPPDAEHGPEG